jgi:RsiW-degrading membrane proteinase PrsW (M82 family)
MYAILVLAISVAPALLFMLLIMRMDRREPEPLGLVLRVIGLGACSAVVASIAENLLGLLPYFHGQGSAANAISSFLQIAPVEEMCKLGVVLAFVWRNPNFNEENDGIVYVGASAIGFALLENILYVAENGIGTGVLRAISAMPLHVFTAIVLGLHVGRARFAAGRGARILLIARGLALAWIFHGLYDTFALSGSAVALLLLPLIGGLVTLGVIVLKRGRRLSIARWAAASEVNPPAALAGVAASQPMPAAPVAPHAPVWMAVISRILLGACAMFWLLLAIGLAVGEQGADLGFAALGGILITFIPACLGALLETAYRKRRKRLKLGIMPISPVSRG